MTLPEGAYSGRCARCRKAGLWPSSLVKLLAGDLLCNACFAWHVESLKSRVRSGWSRQDRILAEWCDR